MKLKVLLAIIGLIFIVSCSKESPKPEQKQKVSGPATVTLEALNSGSYEYKNGDVIVEGLCVHVCAHSGKKMFIAGNNPDDKLQIFTGDDMSVFPKDFEGNKVRVVGYLEEEKWDMSYVTEIQTDVEKEAASQGKKACNFEENMRKVNNLKEKIEKSPKGYISKYTMTCKEVKKI